MHLHVGRDALDLVTRQRPQQRRLPRAVAPNLQRKWELAPQVIYLCHSVSWPGAIMSRTCAFAVRCASAHQAVAAAEGHHDGGVLYQVGAAVGDAEVLQVQVAGAQAAGVAGDDGVCARHRRCRLRLHRRTQQMSCKRAAHLPSCTSVCCLASSGCLWLCTVRDCISLVAAHSSKRHRDPPGTLQKLPAGPSPVSPRAPGSLQSPSPWRPKGRRHPNQTHCNRRMMKMSSTPHQGGWLMLGRMLGTRHRASWRCFICICRDQEPPERRLDEVAPCQQLAVVHRLLRCAAHRHGTACMQHSQCCANPAA